MFLPMAILGFAVLTPVDITDDHLRLTAKEVTGFSYDDLDTLSVSNVSNSSHRFAISAIPPLYPGSPAYNSEGAKHTDRFFLSLALRPACGGATWHVPPGRLWAHVVMAYLFSAWTWWLLHREYRAVTRLRLNFLADQRRKPDQFTVLTRNVPPHPVEDVSQHVDHFFHVNHRDHYLLHQVVYNANKLDRMVHRKKWTVNRLTALSLRLERKPDKPRPTHKTGRWGLWGPRVDSITFFEKQLEDLNQKDKKAIMPAAFVSFRTRWGAAVAAQTQQTSNSATWRTDWAPEPRDVVWSNLPIKYVELSGRRALVTAAVFGLVFFYMIPVSFVQSLADLSSLQKTLPWLKPLTDAKIVKGFLQGFLPGLALKLFLLVLPAVLRALSTLEGWVSRSTVERKTAGKFFIFMAVNVFFGNILTGSTFSQLKAMIEEPTKIPNLFGNTIPIKATFFMTYTMVDAWAGLSAEIFRLFPLIMYHTQAMRVTGVSYAEGFPQLELYYLLGLVYCTITPLLLPFLLVFFGFGYIVYRNQVINVYEPEYETAAGYWPHVHGRIVAAQIIQHLTLIGLFSIKKAALQAPFLIPLPFLTLAFHYVLCKGPFEPAFHRYALEVLSLRSPRIPQVEANRKDELDTVREDPLISARAFLAGSYLHPVLKKALGKDKYEEGLEERKLGYVGPALEEEGEGEAEAEGEGKKEDEMSGEASAARDRDGDGDGEGQEEEELDGSARGDVGSGGATVPGGRLGPERKVGGKGESKKGQAVFTQTRRGAALLARREERWMATAPVAEEEAMAQKRMA
eukprot:jgi/Mesen1/10417/ME000818S09896